MALVLVGALAAGVGACGAGAGAGAGAGGSRAGRGSASHGTAVVAYAGSLEAVNEKVIGPGFEAVSGDGYQGRAGGSLGLAKEIASKEIDPNVFVSVGAAPMTELEPSRTDWYVEMMASPLVVAYDPHGPYAAELAAIAAHKKPLADLFTLMARPGFKLGRTNPATDPQGQAFFEMVELAQRTLGLPAGTTRAILGPAENPRQVFAETALEARLQAGQLDAASALVPQARSLGLPYVALPASLDFADPALAAHYASATVSLPGGQTAHGVPLVVDATTLSAAPAAAAYVAYLLSPSARAAYAKVGYQLLAPLVVGNRASVPGAVARALG